MQIGILGAGHIGSALAKHFTQLQHTIAIANSRGPETLGEVAEKTGATPVQMTEVANAVLLGWGLRRAELAAAQVADQQQREEHWVFADLIGEGGRIRTVPIPDWVAEAVALWLREAGVTNGGVYRAINKAGRIAPNEFSRKVIWVLSNRLLPVVDLRTLRHTIFAEHARASVSMPGENSNRFSSCSDTSASRRLNGISAANSD